jgi:HlyD family secretion protein
MQILERPSSNGHAGHSTIVVPPSPRRTIPWRVVAAVAVVLALLAGIIAFARIGSTATPAYVTQPVQRGDLAQTVTATGTVNPQNTISVGTQVSGTISEVDVDYNSQVHKGQVLARIDPTALQAQLASAQAALAQSKAQAASAADTAQGAALNIGAAQASAQAAAATARAAQATALAAQQAIASADAGVTKAQSALTLAQMTLARDKTLLAQGFIPQNQADTDASTLVAAQTALQSAQVAAQQARSQAAASVAQAQASQASVASQNDTAAVAGQNAGASGATAGAQAAAIGIQEAAVQQAQTNLDHAVITSPVDGTVIARDVSVGTTVAASLQTPTLFSIAQNLDKMEVDLAVGEPDIGSVKPGAAVSFTVLAYPNRTFHGTVSQVRKNPVTTSNVVTYTTVVLVENNDQALLPGMTANATIDVQAAKNALIVPAAALTFRPTGGTATHRTAATQTAGTPWGASLTGATSAPTTGGRGRIFVQRDGKLVRVPVQIVLATSTQAAVTPLDDATLAAGDMVVTGGAATHASGAGARGATAQSPFAGGPPAGMRGIGR